MYLYNLYIYIIGYTIPENTCCYGCAHGLDAGATIGTLQKAN